MELYIYMFALRKSVKDRFSEGTEAVVLFLVVFLRALYYWSDLQTTSLRVL